MSDGCVYHLQQCVEKLFKACLLQQDQTVQKTHDLVRLSQMLQDVDPKWSWDEDELEELLERKGMATRLREAPLLRLGRTPKDSPP